MPILVFDDATRFRLLPFTHTRPVADIRCGILTMRERWERLLGATTGTLSDPSLQELFPAETGTDNLLVNGAVFATAELAAAAQALTVGQALVKDGFIIAARTDMVPAFDALAAFLASLSVQTYTGAVERLDRVWDIFSKNDMALRADFRLLTEGRQSESIPTHVTVSRPDQVFIEPGAVIHPCIINAATGPVYIGADAEIMEGCLLRGPLSVGPHVILKMGAKVYGATTLGPGCRAGGELNNVVMFANSNKGHDGFLGNAVLGEWCNLGAGTESSNLKNNYGEVKIWDEHTGKSVSTGLQFCGLLMGDHSKAGINTMFNTGTVVGVSCNIYGGGFPEKFVPSFSWGGAEGMTTYGFDQAMDTARRVMARRQQELSEAAVRLYRHVFEHSRK
jgi:UDP-N-acetylglucosamine diphosphorylase/glucosamine-1-phosphate N-acetyltransferase